MRSSRALIASGLSAAIAEEVTTTSASSIFVAVWPSCIFAPNTSSLSVLSFFSRSDPEIL